MGCFSTLSQNDAFHSFQELKRGIESERGWDFGAVSVGAGLKGLAWPDEAIIEEIVSIEIEAWRRMSETKGTEK
ncbi:MAG TPA: hypothetical protein VFD58_07215 [Blastocatellia bacterium]|nr:hypothetical protein [Blastocatellia bacterium]